MKQIQTLILEKSDLDKLKSGENLTLNLSNGHSVQLAFDRKYRRSNDYSPELKIKGRILQFYEVLKKSKQPLTAKDVGMELNISRQNAFFLGKELLKKGFIERNNGLYSIAGGEK